MPVDEGLGRLIHRLEFPVGVRRFTSAGRTDDSLRLSVHDDQKPGLSQTLARAVFFGPTDCGVNLVLGKEELSRIGAR